MISQPYLGFAVEAEWLRDGKRRSVSQSCPHTHLKLSEEIGGIYRIKNYRVISLLREKFLFLLATFAKLLGTEEKIFFY